MHTKVFVALQQKYNIFSKDYTKLTHQEKMNELEQLGSLKNLSLKDELLDDTLKVMKAVRLIQKQNGEEGCNRYIISHCENSLHIMEVMALFKVSGWNWHKLPMDIVPLFETIEDLQNAEAVMRELFENKLYKKHLQNRGNNQTIMLGFSDGTKDGGYLMANWRIYEAKETLSALAREFDINILFFDGRGGPPSRGGGKTHRFYASMADSIENKEIQLTIQGQTVSANFGTIEAAAYNLEQLINAGILNDVVDDKIKPFSEEERHLFESLSQESYNAYCDLKFDPHFTEYLTKASPLKYYGDTNIGSRPTKRNASSQLNLNDLRAIPYVGSWSQIKQNVTGYYGLGTALKSFEQKGKWSELRKLYEKSLFFRALLDNSEMSMQKCFFPLTQYQAKNKEYGNVWKKVHEEYLLTKTMILKLSGKDELMQNYPVEKMSIQMRERIVLPLLTIQQYAMNRINEIGESDKNLSKTYEKMIMRCSFGIINAGRNSA